MIKPRLNVVVSEEALEMLDKLMRHSSKFTGRENKSFEVEKAIREAYKRLTIEEIE